MRYKKIPNSLFIRNRAKLTKKLKPNSLAIIVSNDEMPRNGDQTFAYKQNSGLFYLSGLDQEKCILTIFPDHPLEDQREIAFTVKTDQTMEIWNGKKYSFDDAREISGIKAIKWLDEFDAVLKDLMGRAEHVYLELNEYPKFFTEVPYKALRFSQQLRQEYPLHKFERLAPLLTDLRLIKESEEIEMIRHACKLTGNAFLRVLKMVKPAIKEFEVEAEINHEFLRNGASGSSFHPIVASGPGTCVLHYNQNNKTLKDGELLLLDFGAEYGNYATDCSRTIPVSGKFTPRQAECYDAVLWVYKKAIQLFVPGNTIDNINAEVNKMLEKEMINLGLFTEKDLKNQDSASPLYFKYFMHGTSHFLGLDVHDVGSKQEKFHKGMVLTCEPGIYIAEENIGIRIETDVLVDKIPVDLMDYVPVERDEIERLMASR